MTGTQLISVAPPQASRQPPARPKVPRSTPGLLLPEPTGAGAPWLHTGSIPALDGLRGLAIGLVLLGHASLTWCGAPASPDATLARFGSTGVDLFFVISGFLITLLMLRERQRNGTVSLRAFFTRRAWRILPAYLAFLATLFALTSFGLVKLTGRDWAGSLTYTVNFLPGTGWPVGHLWSLSVEEHFYLLWPILMLFAGPGRACAIAAAYFAVAPVVRLMITQLAMPALDIDYCTPARIDTIAAGCLLAYVANHAGLYRCIKLPSLRWAAGLAFVAVGGLILSNIVLRRSGLYSITLRHTFDALCFAGLIWAGVSYREGLLSRVLNATALVWLGRLSYGLYLWQQPFLNPRDDQWFCQWPVNLIVAVVCAVACFVLIERPALRLRERMGWGRV